MEDEDKVEKHPSYGTIRISRQTWNRVLFQSAVRHQFSIALEISHASVHHCMSGMDNVWPDKPIIEILLSEAQFARAVTSMNMGSGSPCTINRLDGKIMPDPPIFEVREAHVRNIDKAVNEKMQQAQSVLASLEKLLEEKKRPTLKEVEALANELRYSLNYFKTNFQFYVDTFTEKMETIVADAKIEVEAHTQAVITKLGMEAIAEQFPRLGVKSNE